MHYHAEVWIESLEDIEGSVWDAMKPYKERDCEIEDDFRGVDYDYSVCFWDWYQIGGRWHNKVNTSINVRHVKDIPDDLTAATLVLKDRVIGGDWREAMEKDIKVKEKLEELGITEGYLVTVDYHN